MKFLKRTLFAFIVPLAILNNSLEAQIIKGSTRLENASHYGSLAISGLLDFSNLKIAQTINLYGFAARYSLKCEKFMDNKFTTKP